MDPKHIARLLTTLLSVLFIWAIGPHLINAFQTTGMTGGLVFMIASLMAYIIGVIVAIIAIFFAVLLMLRFLFLSGLGLLFLVGMLTFQYEKSRDFSALGISPEYAAACFKVEACRKDLYSAHEAWSKSSRTASPLRKEN